MNKFSYIKAYPFRHAALPTGIAVRRFCLFVLVITSISGHSNADPSMRLSDAVRQAVLENPEVNLEWQRLRAAQQANKASKGALLPEVNLSADLGQEQRSTPQTDFDPYNRASGTLTISQLLFDGFTALQVSKERQFESNAQYYQLRNSAEQIGLQTANAFLDAYRHQQLIDYAVDNLTEHRLIYKRIEERTSGGLDADVDLDQATARLKLAESNVLVEVNNLNDVASVYQRLVGVPVAKRLAEPVSTLSLPTDRDTALALAFENNPFLNAQVETIHARLAGFRASKGRFAPSVSLRYRNTMDKNREGIVGSFDEQALEVVVLMNLYRGGTDASLSKEAQSLYYAAIEAQQLACINVKQNILTAINEVDILNSRIDILASNLESQERSKDAYKQQFEIGQRSLLDMLDGVNEYFVTRNSLLNARVDLRQAEHRALATMGVLLAQIGLTGLRADVRAAYELALLERSAALPDSVCSVEVPQAVTVDIDAIYQAADDEFESQRRSVFEGDGGFGGFDIEQLSLPEQGALSDTLPPGLEEQASLIDEMVVYFASDSADISLGDDEQIQAAAAYLFDDPTLRAVIEGHSDDVGSSSSNEALSLRRAEAIKRRLVQQYTIDPGKIDIMAYGESRPVLGESGAASRNRRAVISILGKENASQVE